MRKLIYIIAALFLNSCSGDSEGCPGYTEVTAPDVYEVCNDGECGVYPELMKCGDGSSPKDIRCVFVPKFGCKWIIFECFEG